MTFFYIFSILIVLAAIFGYFNYRYLKLPNTIGLMIIALAMSLTLIVAGLFNSDIIDSATQLIASVDFPKAVLDVMLSFLLFAGALHADVKTLSAERVPIFVFASIGVLISTFFVGTALWLLLPLLGLGIDYIYCLIFGALISPTDPIAVLAILKTAKVPKALETKIAGESLFNDGVGVVIFLSLFEIARRGSDAFGLSDVALLFLVEVGGGLLWGALIGYGAYYLLRQVDSHLLEVTITLATVMGGYSLATALHLSGPLAVVIAGLLIGSKGRESAMSETTETYVDIFWEVLDEVLNAVLFILIGLEALVVSLTPSYALVGALAILITLLARLIAVGLPITLMRLRREFVPRTIRVMTWGGLRGGISVALALSLPVELQRELILSITYIVVVFSIIVQGLTVKWLVKDMSELSTKATT
ncbi:MAG: cation:proton antiporter [Candidatus Thermochlorobacter sp.]